ncbi:probable serine/threonine-protein kinase PBL15 isoform X1 [Hibiscus syriacus]|uniref:probable serine/threonine-protein kinase PBL15 isoform X1 n=2 Tax=Hibiscus syriacus TaxID=106335 RepID=UPI001921E23F|nr:probable serine/threonine-protein kinase PBL15 isoform X1 [Hibiscus syriacus]
MLIRKMSMIVIIICGAAGALVFVAVIVGFIWFYKSCKNFSKRNSETGSSDPSALMEWNKGAGLSSSAGPQGARQFRLEELEQATKQFADSNLIGFGSFGPVYKGWIRDNVVVIKRHQGAPREEFNAGAIYLSEIRHRNLVTLLGYCQERGSQILVYECIPNGSMCNHLYDTGREAPTRLEFKQRLSIALGAARGLCHLHSLIPPLIHKNFKTANVLVDENFTAKVADAGITMLLEKIEEAGPSQGSRINVFRDPEVEALGSLTEMSDVYSFGVFLMELITGRDEAVHIDYLRSNDSLIQLVQSQLSSNELVDRRLAGSFTMDGIKDVIKLTLKCMCFPGKRRLNMNMIVEELERINEKEMELTTVTGEGTSKITLGSELFASK